MTKVKIQNLMPGVVPGIGVQIPGAVVPYRENYFEWASSSLAATLKTREVSGGILKAWHHVPVFKEVETHVDEEMFYFVSGVGLMLFMDVDNGRPMLETAQVVRIQPDTQIIIPAGKGHFVPVAEGDDPVEIVVVAPRMDAPRIALPDSVEGI
jgi:mannose-6-phosphate isomerase-like protein (cupin superfamily)